jgi:hypothetical protein
MDIRTKFQVSDELFTLKDMKIISFRVQNISVFCAHKDIKISYGNGVDYNFYEERVCFRTKEDLLRFIQE